MRDLPALLRAAERRVNAKVWPNHDGNRGADSHLASIPANRDTDTDLLLIEAAERIEKLQDANNIVTLIDERMGKGWTRDLAHALFPGNPCFAKETDCGHGQVVQNGCPHCERKIGHKLESGGELTQCDGEDSYEV